MPEQRLRAKEGLAYIRPNDQGTLFSILDPVLSYHLPGNGYSILDSLFGAIFLNRSYDTGRVILRPLTWN